MQQPPLGYTWEGIIDFLSFHQSILKAREDQFDQEKAKFNIRIVSLEQEVGNLKLINHQMSQRISELEIKLGIENPHSRIFKQGQPIKEVKNKHHSRVKSDLVQNFGRQNEEFLGNNSMCQKQTMTAGLSFHGGSSSISFQQAGSKTGALSLSNTFDGITEDSQNVEMEDQIGTSFLKFDNLMRQNQQSSSVNNSVIMNNNNNINTATSNGNAIGGDQTFDQTQQQQNGKQKKAKKSNGSQKNTIIYNQTTVNSINSNNFISAFNNQHMQINQAVQNSFISANKQQQQQATPSSSSTQSNTAAAVATPSSASNNGQHQQQNQTQLRLQEGMSKSTPPNLQQQQQQNVAQVIQNQQQQSIGNGSSQIFHSQVSHDLTSSQNGQQKQKSKLKTNNLHINTNLGVNINATCANNNNNNNNSNSNSHSNNGTTTKSLYNSKYNNAKSLIQSTITSDKTQNNFMNSAKSIITTNATSPHAMSDSSNENQMITGKKIWNPKCTLRSHLDGVRGLFFTAVDPILVTASEDCSIKLWDIRQFKEHNESSYFQPYYTIRGHSGQIFTITGNQQQVDSSINFQCYNFVFSAGVDGVIKAWNLPLPEEIDALGPSEGKNVSVGEWQAHHEVIWDLNHHPFQPILLSSGADGYIKLWKTFVTVEGTSLVSLQQGDLISYLSYKPGQFQDIPTSVAWDHQRSSIISGWVQSNNLVSFNSENSKISGIMKYNQDNPNLSAQVNKVICHEGINCAISGHEDRQIRFFDLKSNTLIKNLIGHTDAVTGLSVHPNQFYMSSVGHDGSMRTWDIRKYQCIHDIPVHKRKYDESVHTVMYHQKLPLIATGGADGLVKIFHQQDMI